MRQGAYDYLTKPVDLDRLRLLIEKALDRARTLDEITILRRRVKDVWGLGRLIGRSAPMQEVHRLIEQAAATSAPVLIHGETGTGKELVARTLHELSARAGGPFVAVNCAAMPETLLESEIFGHERGAFTDARDRREGCFELAHGGTLLLDEVAEMQPGIQAKFLRVLEEGSFRRLGGKSEIKVDVRVVAHHKDPIAAVKEGAFREDLYYRLNVFTLSVPPLRQRVEDIPLIVTGFIEEFNGKYDKRITGADDATLKILMAHAWPGNVRELRNVVERTFIACEGDVYPHCRAPRRSRPPPHGAAIPTPSPSPSGYPCVRSRSSSCCAPWPPRRTTRPARPSGSRSARRRSTTCSSAGGCWGAPPVRGRDGDRGDGLDRRAATRGTRSGHRGPRPVRRGARRPGRARRHPPGIVGRSGRRTASRHQPVRPAGSAEASWLDHPAHGRDGSRDHRSGRGGLRPQRRTLSASSGLTDARDR
jgi:hypothetical protein